MITFIFHGKILPERASLNIPMFGMRFAHDADGGTDDAHISIINNQLNVWVETEKRWDLADLRNVVRSLVQHNLSLAGYLLGYAYDLEITGVVTDDRSVDLIYGIETPCIAERHPRDSMAERFNRWRPLTVGRNGMFLNRCFGDLVSAMRESGDTGFYCYRAIETLRLHCAAIHDRLADDKTAQWIALREFSGVERADIEVLKVAADPLRHGDIVGATGEERARQLTTTWNIVDRYLEAVERFGRHAADAVQA